MDLKELSKQLFEIFAGLDRAHGRYHSSGATSSKGKSEGKGETVFEPVTPELWLRHLSGTEALGICPIMDDGNTWWGALDIDVYSVQGLVEDLSIKLKDSPFVICRSKSGGVHAFVLFKEPIPAREVQEKLKSLAAVLGYGKSEIYPKQTKLISENNDVGNWLNMPYYGGENSTRYCVLEGEPLGLESFLRACHQKRRTRAEFLGFLFPEFESTHPDDDFFEGPPCLQILAKSGFEEGTRNNGLYNVGVYLKKRYPDQWAALLSDYNERYMKPPLDGSEVRGVLKGLDRKTYNFKCNDQPICSRCDRPTCLKRDFGVAGDEAVAFPLLSSLTKINSQPPTYFLDVDGHRVGPLETDELIQQGKFDKAVVEAMNRILPVLTSSKWRKRLEELFKTISVVEVPEDSSREGLLLQFLEQFFDNLYTSGDEKDGLLMGKSWRFDEYSYFRLKDFLEFMERNLRFRDFKNHHVVALLKNKGASHEAFKVKGKFINVWKVKRLPAQSESFDLPDVPSSEF